MELKKNIGQSTVEYLLLTVVISTLAIGVLNSELVKKFLGPQGEFMRSYKTTLELNYRHAYPASKDVDPYEDYGAYTGRHHSFNVNAADSRFFIPVEKYP